MTTAAPAATNVIHMARRKPRYSQGEEALTPDELLAVLKAARHRSARDWAMILIAYGHGYRAAEICALRLDDIKDGAITTPRLKGSLKTVQPLYEHRGQPLLDETKALKAYLAERVRDGSPFVFVSRKGGDLHPSQFFRVFQGIAKSVGLPREKCYPHVLKHSLASHLIARNTNLALVRQALGHRSINSTMKYVRVTDEQAANAVRSALMETF